VRASKNAEWGAIPRESVTVKPQSLLCGSVRYAPGKQRSCRNREFAQSARSLYAWGFSVCLPFPEEADVFFNHFTIERKREMKNHFKRPLALLLSLLLLTAILPAAALAADSADVYVTLSVAGELVKAQQPVTVTDANGSGALDIDDVLRAFHDACYPGGAAAGYASETTSFGLSLKKLWGDTSGYFGYYVNNASAWSLADEVVDGDWITAFVYADQTDWSDQYAFFSADRITAAIGQPVSLTLYAYSYDADWNLVAAPLADAAVSVSDTASTYTTDENGSFTLTFSKSGAYTVTAAAEGAVLVPPVCTVIVDDAAAVREAADRVYAVLPGLVPLKEYSDAADWAALIAARAGLPASILDTAKHYVNFVSHVQTKSGVLSETKYTEYSRSILAIGAAGYDPAHVYGYDLLTPLRDVEKTAAQGITGTAYGLLALASAGVSDQALLSDYAAGLLGAQLSDGGWALSGTVSDPDVTAIVLQALSLVREQSGVSDAITAGLACLSQLQLANGGFKSYGAESCESAAQVLIALCQLGVSPDDARFVKDTSPVGALLGYQLEDGSFAHTAGGETNRMATLQAALALTALTLAENGEMLFDFSDAAVTYSDLDGHADAEIITRLSACGVVSGMGDGTFLPDKTMTRAEFCAIAVRALALAQSVSDHFADVPTDRWYAPYIGAAFGQGIILGRSDDSFDPEGLITDVEAQIIVSRCAVLLKTAESSDENWSPSDIRITRCEMCRLFFDLLTEAGRI